MQAFCEFQFRSIKTTWSVVTMAIKTNENI